MKTPGAKIAWKAYYKSQSIKRRITAEVLKRRKQNDLLGKESNS